MIKKINKLKDVGIFSEFSWDGLDEFSKFNLIYGWNYSGKTTLSRVFRCFELKRLHDDFKLSTFEIERHNQDRYGQSQLMQSFAVRVFNSDFIKENLKWEEGIEPVLLVGEENIELEKQLKAYKAKIEEKEKKIFEWRSNINAKNAEIENGLTSRARNIKNTLSIPDFEKPQFRLFVEEVKGATETYKLTDEQEQPLIQAYQSTDKKNKIPEIVMAFPDMPKLSEQTGYLLKITATANIIERLRGNAILEKWVKEGKGLHEGKPICQFCGSKLPNDLLDNLSKHFSEEYSLLMNDIDHLIENLENNKATPLLLDKAIFYTELREDYEQSKEKWETAVNVLNLSIDELVMELEDKKTKPFESVVFENHKNSAGELKIQMETVNVIIRKHNNKTDDFERDRNTAKEKLLKHWASKFAIDLKYKETIEKSKEIENRINIRLHRLSKIRTEVERIEQQLSDAVKGAGKINEYIHGYFGTDEIKMTVAEDGKHFKLERSGRPAKNLSEGEKTAIAFSHFVAKLEENDNNLNQTIIFIDDPISSLDSNHLFHTYSFIKTKLENCKQLFISTHNYEFFNLMKEWRRKNNKYPDTSLYLVEKTKTGEISPFKSNLLKLPVPLSKYQSEYVYLFSLLYIFNEKIQQDYGYLYILPNILRRYLEAYVGFRFLGGLSNNLYILIEDETQQEKVYKFINAYSHNSSIPRLLHFPDFSECKDVIKMVLEAVKNKDEEHYNALIDKI